LIAFDPVKLQTFTISDRKHIFFRPKGRNYLKQSWLW